MRPATEIAETEEYKFESGANEMISADNIAILKKHFPGVYQKLQEEEGLTNRDLAKAIPAKNGAKTLSINKNGQSLFMHSRYDPVREAGAVLDQYEDIEKYKYVVFYGLGLGYHVQAFAERYPKKSFYIHEPVPEIFYEFLANRQLKDLPVKSLQNISFGSSEANVSGFLSDILQRARNEILVIELPAHKEIFPEAYEEFSRFSKSRVKDTRSAWRTNYSYQKRWILNSIINFNQVIHTPDILLEHKGIFQGKPALLVAAGPSLDEEIENLRYIKENGLAYIFTVGSAINTLVHHDLYPHAACTYDPSKINQKVFQKLVDQKIVDIPLFFGSSVGFETLAKYPGPKLHMLTTQDTVSGYFLKPNSGNNLVKVMDAPTIALVTLELLFKLGFSEVLLVGQNFSFKDRQKYAGGIDHVKALSDAEEKNAFWVKDVDGNDIMTNESFNRMRLQMQSYIKKFDTVDFINTTAGGAEIEGAPFHPLQSVVEEDLKTPVVDEDWQAMTSRCYDASYMQERLGEMNTAYAQNQALLEKLNNHLRNIERLCRNKNFKQAENTYKQLDQTFNAIKANTFFKTFILPMNRVYYQMLTNETTEIKTEKNALKKGELVINAFGRFIHECRKDVQLVAKVYPTIQKAIEKYARSAE